MRPVVHPTHEIEQLWHRIGDSTLAHRLSAAGTKGWKLAHHEPRPVNRAGDPYLVYTLTRPHTAPAPE